jgi:starvation-inducible DNA-binding protein
MTKQMLDADTLLKRATPITGQEAVEMPKGREEVPVQVSRLLHAHEIVLKEARAMARRAADAGDDGTNDVIVSEVIRRNELQVWFVAQHVVNVPVVEAR